MTPEQKNALLKQILVGLGVLSSANVSDLEAQQALQVARQQDPVATNQALVAGGYPTTPWLTILGIGAGAVAAYLLWRHYSGKRVLGVIERPEVEDPAPRLRTLSRALGHFKGRTSSCRMGRMGRLGDHNRNKYEFEPEIRLEGHRGTRRRGARR